ncbi:MAG: Do family serine endopeptidase [Clostridia bacterium]|nr:Do family serine endopeptidase [Deltaproteobacteria bacterium]
MSKAHWVLAIFLLAAPAYAQSSKLFSERASSAAPLTQIPNFSALAKQVTPAVVSIHVEQRAKLSRSRNPHDFWFFGPEGNGPQREYGGARGLGSGFVIRADGLILTNNHVVEEAETIDIELEYPNGTVKTLRAKVLGTAPEYDVALIQTEEDAKAPIAYLGDSDAVDIGDWVMAVGNPFGLSHSVSTGIISAKERRDIAPSGRTGLYDFLQTDASINPGNSGGPLINMRGEVIGINSAVNAQGSGIGFAIPMNMVKAMLPDLQSKGKYSRSWIGIRIQSLTPELAQSYGLPGTAGALVAETVSGGPAQVAGIKDGDVLLSFNGQELRRSTDLPLFASMAGVGREVPVKVWRGGKELTLKVKLAAFPDEKVQASANEGPHEGTSAQLGLTVNDITPQVQKELELASAKGVLVKNVDPSGLAARSGLRPADVILSLNSEEVTSAKGFATLTKALKPGSVMRLQVQRGDAKIYVALRQP